MGKKKYKLFKEIKNKFIKKLILKIYRQKLLIEVKINLLDFILGVYIVPNSLLQLKVNTSRIKLQHLQ